MATPTTWACDECAETHENREEAEACERVHYLERAAAIDAACAEREAAVAAAHGLGDAGPTWARLAVVADEAHGYELTVDRIPEALAQHEALKAIAEEVDLPLMGGNFRYLQKLLTERDAK